MTVYESIDILKSIKLFIVRLYFAYFQPISVKLFHVLRDGYQNILEFFYTLFSVLSMCFTFMISLQLLFKGRGNS